MRDQIFDLQRRYGSLAAYANKITRTERSESARTSSARSRFLLDKGHTAFFNGEQIDGLPDHYYAQPAPRFDPIDCFRIEARGVLLRATGADIRYGGGRAFYSPSQDFIRMPPFEAFPLHAESPITQPLRIENRALDFRWYPNADLDRDFGRKRFRRRRGYAIEELVA